MYRTRISTVLNYASQAFEDHVCIAGRIADKYQSAAW